MQVIPATASYSGGLVYFSQAPAIQNQINVANPLQPTPPPVVVVTPLKSGGGSAGLGNFIFGVGGFGIPPATSTDRNAANLAIENQFASEFASNNPFSNLFNNPFFASLPNLFIQNQDNRLNEQIGTRLATDYTPNVFPVTRKFPDLEGGIEIREQLTEIPGKAIFGASEFTAGEVASLTNLGVQCGQNSKGDFISLMKGYVLFAPDKAIVVHFREGTVYIPEGCIAWVLETGADSAIYDLHDSLSTGSFRVVVSNKEIKMGPGTQLLLTRDMHSCFDALNPGSSVAYRNIQSADAVMVSRHSSPTFQSSRLGEPRSSAQSSLLP